MRGVLKEWWVGCANRIGEGRGRKRIQSDVSPC